MIECSEQILEIDTILVTPYVVMKLMDNYTSTYYSFKTEDDDKYVIVFNRITNQNNFSVTFTLSGADGTTKVVNKGRFFKIMSTVSQVTLSFILNKKPNMVLFHATQNFEGDTRRYDIYKRYILNGIPNGYILEEDSEKNNLIVKNI